MTDKLGLYIHIPFCRSKCPYCDFFSMRADNEDFDRYVEILNNNIKVWADKLNKIVDTIYIGGGTPSVIGADRLANILRCVKSSFNVSSNAEITVEVNPSSGKFFDFSQIAKLGVNRISLGLQSAGANELRTLGRLHSAEDVVSTINLIRNSGIKNISLDLMVGIPGQTIDSLKTTIDFCASQNIEHISAYILKIENGTIFQKRYDNYDFPNDDETAEMYLFSVNYLADNGFEQYEISNFSKPGFESKHNLKYWKLEDYLGLGPAAHSFVNGERFYYERDIKGFEKNIIRSEGKGGGADEYVMLGLRLNDGLSLDDCKKILGEKNSENLLKKSERYIKAGLMALKDNHLSFTPKGFLVSNAILSDLI